MSIGLVSTLRPIARAVPVKVVKPPPLVDRALCCAAVLLCCCAAVLLCCCAEALIHESPLEMPGSHSLDLIRTAGRNGGV